MTAMTSFEGKAERPSGGLTAALLGGLAVASLVELLILRTFTRTAIHIPDLPALQGPFEVLSLAGRYAYFVSVVLLMAVLPATAAMLWRTRTGSGSAGAIAIAGFILVAAMASIGTGNRALLDAATLASVALLAASAAITRGWQQGVAFSLFGAAFLAAGLHTSLQSAGQEVLVKAAGQPLLLAAELAGVGFAFTSPLAVCRRTSRGTFIAGALAALLTFAFFQGGGGSTARILLLWNGGLQGALPGAVYAAAAGSLAVAAFGLYRDREVATLIGLSLLLAGGLGLHNTYQTGLVVVGFAALQLAASARTGEARPG